MLWYVTLVIQAVVAYIPLKLHYDMGHRIWYSVKTFGLVGELVWLLVIVGLPTAALWNTYRSARRRTQNWRIALSYAGGLVGVAVFTAPSCFIVAASGIR